MTDPKCTDNMYWKYQGLIESFLNFISNRPDVMADENLRVQAFAHITRKIYDMGYEDARKDFDPGMIEIIPDEFKIKQVKIDN